MVSNRSYVVRHPPKGQPAWDIARLFPEQGHWSEHEYLALNTNRLVEFADGYVEVLPMPTMSHQFIVQFLYRMMFAYLERIPRGRLLTAPFRIKIVPPQSTQYRQPDVMFMLDEHADRVREEFWIGADLVMEVVSEDDPSRDFELKRFEYARGGIPEYWIIDPRSQQVTLLVLEGSEYREAGVFGRGERVASRLLNGFEVDVAAVFDAARAS